MSNNSSLRESLIVERYKYILGSINRLNEDTGKVLSFFQTALSAIIAAIVYLLVGNNGCEVSGEIAKLGITILNYLLITLTLFSVTRIIINTTSWYFYRLDEVKLLNSKVQSNYRKAPSLKNLWRWSETYLVLVFLVVGVGGNHVVVQIILPSLVGCDL